MKKAIRRNCLSLTRGAPLLLALGLFLGTAAHAQSCSLCRDASAGSAPHARASLRRGILVLGIPAGAIFLGILCAARHFREER
jgi:hypothetical protein